MYTIGKKSRTYGKYSKISPYPLVNTVAEAEVLQKKWNLKNPVGFDVYEVDIDEHTMVKV